MHDVCEAISVSNRTLIATDTVSYKCVPVLPSLQSTSSLSLIELLSVTVDSLRPTNSYWYSSIPSGYEFLSLLS